MFAPIISFLQDKGLWDPLVGVWHIFTQFASELFNWIGHTFDVTKLGKLLLAFIVFLIKISIGAFHLLASLISWIGGLFS